MGVWGAEVNAAFVPVRWNLVCLGYVCQFCPEVYSPLAVFSWSFTVFLHKLYFLRAKENLFWVCLTRAKENLFVTEVCGTVSLNMEEGTSFSAALHRWKSRWQSNIFFFFFFFCSLKLFCVLFKYQIPDIFLLFYIRHSTQKRLQSSFLQI